jgi:hypothetical protein
MDPNELLKLTGVIAALIAATVSLTLFLVKETVDKRKVQQRAFRTIYLYCRSLQNALRIEPKPSEHLSISDVYSHAQEVVFSAPALAALSDYEDALLAWKRADNLNRQLSDSERKDLIKKLDFSMRHLKNSHRF